MSPPVVLSIAGSDNSAGAGAQADLKTMSALGVYGVTAITCVVAEVPGKVSAIQAIEPRMVAEQIRLSFEAFPVGAVKTGMLYSREIIEVVCETLAECMGRCEQRPPLVVDATPEMKVCSQEVFGPVVAVTRYDDFDDALRMANDTRYGLQAGVFTADVTKALHAARTLDFGGVLINEVPTWRADQQPYGGLRDSGNTREGPAWSVREMTEERLIILTG